MNTAVATGAMGARPMPFTKIPTIDIGALFNRDPTARRRVADEIGKACEEVGFFYIANHGVPQTLIDQVLCANPFKRKASNENIA